MSLNDDIKKLIFSLITIYKHLGIDNIATILQNADSRLLPGDKFYPDDPEPYQLNLEVPLRFFASIQDAIYKIETDIHEKLKPLIRNYYGEYLQAVVIMPKLMQSDTNSTDMEGANQNISLDDNSIWEKDYYKLFFSHTSKHNKVASQLQIKFKEFAISLFVAHKDIPPPHEGEKTIISATYSMNALVVWCTNDLIKSEWCDQEIGIAIGRDVLIIPIKAGSSPHGFIRKFQAISFHDNDTSLVCKNVFDILMTNSRTKLNMVKAIINKMCNSTSIRECQRTLSLIEAIQKEITIDDARKLIEASKSNTIIRNDSNISKSIRTIVTTKFKAF